MTGRAKWDAWKAAGQTYGDGGQDAEDRYLELAKSMGWIEGVKPVEPEKKLATNEGDAKVDVEDEDGDGENIWDDDDETIDGGGGMGNSVSAMPAPSPTQEELSTLHGLAIWNKPDALESFFLERPDVNINELDEFVRC